MSVDLDVRKNQRSFVGARHASPDLGGCGVHIMQGVMQGASSAQSLYVETGVRMMDSLESLRTLARLIRHRNAIDREIAAILDRPVHSGHFGEYVASAIFDVELNQDARAKRIDGHFRGGPLAGKNVNVKYGTARDGNLNLAASTDPEDHPDYYLVLTGPYVGPGTSRGKIAPLTIEAVFLFDSQQLLTALGERGIRPGIATSVRRALWDQAMVFPIGHNQRLPLTPSQIEALSLFTDRLDHRASG